MRFLGKHVVLRAVRADPREPDRVHSGRVVGCSATFLCLDGCVFQSRESSADGATGGRTVSPRGFRWVPVSRVRDLRELPAGADPFAPG